ncbi:MOSC domain-containing protein YiiM [Pseudorhizobium tarimense]|uniref:MOSC domain-containing protein YiiM n=1 Tax=Pseudorhizobium tarimense TaxID=1079109 RepID=A0ABV2H2A9_9HYPH|nr:MOSC domain-containing protein [Pseudorhizobium tarimense]MCJ8517761.1 MOSC domain-containing protein [Pseudorhizobium tarimense]
MKLAAICLGRPEVLAGKSYKTGINKTPLHAPVMVDAAGLVGDAVCNRKHHGGPDQAILLEGSVTLDWWMQELGRPLPAGSFGENLVVDGLDNREVCVGDRFAFNEVVLEATAPRIPCATFAARMGDSRFVKRYTAASRPGIYCRVVAGGMIAAGELVRVTPHEDARVAISQLFQLYGKRLTDEQKQAFLAAPLAERLRAKILAS